MSQESRIHGEALRSAHGSSYSQVFIIGAQIRHMECNIGECYKLQDTNLTDVCDQPVQEINRIKRFAPDLSGLY